MKQTLFRAYKEKRDKSIIHDFFSMRDDYATVKALYKEIAKIHGVNVATVQRVLETIGYDGIQGLRKPQNDTDTQ